MFICRLSYEVQRAEDSLVSLMIIVQPRSHSYYPFLGRTAQKMFYIKDLFIKQDQIHRKLWIWSYLLKNSLV